MSLQKIIRMRRRVVLGINSGTSMDGIDLALVQIDPKTEPSIRLLNYSTVPFPDGLRSTLLSAIEHGTAAHWSQLDVLLGQLVADAVLEFVEKHDVKRIDAIGWHGQTVYHHPDDQELFGHKIRSTWQIGDPDVVAKKTGVVTLSHFRQGDVAVGGSGAPLVPILDLELFRDPRQRRLILNLGGIANLTVVGPESVPANLLAFDTGPGNVLIDHFSFLLRGVPHDENGQTAARGSVPVGMLDHLMDHPYLVQPPPKSTGREMFGLKYCQQLEKRFAGARVEDVLRTVTEFTAASIADQIRRYVSQPVDEMIVSGGGARNGFLVERVRDVTGIHVRRSDELGIPAQAKEAVLFAYLADAALSGKLTNVPSVTGATRQALLGRISQP